jgi:cellulose synthase/poly-beta-1,6-N-acetylglucosamine synthase-like glycosyltransferase
MMSLLKYFWLIIYLFALTALFTYGLNCWFLLLVYRLNYRKQARSHQQIKEAFYRNVSAPRWPRVTIQLPIYNEYYVVARLIESVCRIDYPQNLLQVQVLDDSNDDTVAIAGTMVKKMKARGKDIVHVRRKSRAGFKAGALKNGLLTAKGSLIAVFDADFIPNPDFLKESVPYFQNPQIGMLQTRWGHINGDYSLLTRAQAIGIDGHFGVEQAARAWGGFFLNFNGTAGIWRKKTIQESGGWQADTLTEDLDLSYRAQLKGWKLIFAPQVVCPAEIPVTINAFKSQQHRWAKGSIQTAKKNLGRLFKSDLAWPVKIQGFMHLTHYMVHPMMLLVVLTSIPMLYTRWFFDSPAYLVMIFTLLCLATFGPSSLYLFSQHILYDDWKGRIKYLPWLMCLGTGIAVNNTQGVLEALFNIRSGFIRTPKYGIRQKGESWKNKRYTIALTPISILEFFLGIYSLTGLLMFLFFSKYLVSPFLLIYTAGFFFVFFLSVKHGSGKPPAT